jgi:hypothetical protein
VSEDTDIIGALSHKVLDKDAEIERLKDDLCIQVVENHKLESLITELADALEGGASVKDFDCTMRIKLILKAREATKDE